ncbi:hypothetical protein C8039_12555 [Halogeometricum sp. wsp3]|nr:hypothetical protein C8039_12555 [Halogeometricum sp. wsp3]
MGEQAHPAVRSQWLSTRRRPVGPFDLHIASVKADEQGVIGYPHCPRQNVLLPRGILTALEEQFSDVSLVSRARTRRADESANALVRSRALSESNMTITKHNPPLSCKFQTTTRRVHTRFSSCRM